MSDSFDLYIYDQAGMDDIAAFFRHQFNRIGVSIVSDCFIDRDKDEYYISSDLICLTLVRVESKRLNPSIMASYGTSLYNIDIAIEALSGAGYLKTRTCILHLIDALLHRDDRDLVLEFNGEFPILFRRSGKVYVNHQFDDGKKFPFHMITVPAEIVFMPVR